MKKTVTTAELMNRRNSDPDYIARKKARDEAVRHGSAGLPDMCGFLISL
jgi:hypothetical protein